MSPVKIYRSQINKLWKYFFIGSYIQLKILMLSYIIFLCGFVKKKKIKLFLGVWEGNPFFHGKHFLIVYRRTFKNLEGFIIFFLVCIYPLYSRYQLSTTFCSSSADSSSAKSVGSPYCNSRQIIIVTSQGFIVISGGDI